MKDVGVVKKLQKSKRFDQALQEYLDLYEDSAYEGDLFAAGLFMDEIVQTLLLKAGHALSEQELRQQLTQVLNMKTAARVSTVSQAPQVADDIEIAIRKRFPERYRVQEFADPKKGKTDSLS